MIKRDENENLFSIIDAKVKEYKISQDLMCEHLKNAYAVVYEEEDLDADLKFIIDIKGKVFKIRKKLKVVNDDSDIFPYTEIALSEAKKFNKEVKLGEEYYFPIDKPSHKFLIHLQNKLKEFLDRDKNKLLELKYTTKIGEIVCGDITRIKNGYISIDIGDCVAIIEPYHRVWAEDLKIGDQIYALIEEVNLTNTKFELKLSRNNPKLIEKLFEREIDEIQEDIVTIKNIVRTPGIQTIVAVTSEDPNINPATTCIGREAARIKAIRHWVNNEMIIVVDYSPNVETQFKNIFNPSIIESVVYNGTTRVMNVWINNWDENIAHFYGPRKVNLINAMKLCNLFDIRLFDPTFTTKEEILNQDKPTMTISSLEEIQTFTKQEVPKISVLANNTTKTIESSEKVQASESLKEITKEEIIDKSPLSKMPHVSKEQLVNIESKEKAEIETVKRKKEQKTKQKDFLAQQRAKLNLNLSSFDIEDEDNDEEDDDSTYDDEFSKYDLNYDEDE